MQLHIEPQQAESGAGDEPKEIDFFAFDEENGNNPSLTSAKEDEPVVNVKLKKVCIALGRSNYYICNHKCFEFCNIRYLLARLFRCGCSSCVVLIFNTSSIFILSY